MSRTCESRWKRRREKEEEKEKRRRGKKEEEERIVRGGHQVSGNTFVFLVSILSFSWKV